MGGGGLPAGRGRAYGLCRYHAKVGYVEQRPKDADMQDLDKTPYSLRNEVVLITGGGTGIGLAVAQVMVGLGARVVLAGRRAEPLREATEQLGARADFRVHDVTDFEAGATLVEDLERQYGHVTCLVNNAGIHLRKAAERVDEQEFRRLLDVNLLGGFSLARHMAPHMMEQGRGSILFMASMASLFGLPYVVAYSAAKSALLGMIRTLAVEWSARGVRVNAIAPGFIDTEMLRAATEADPARRDRILERTPVGHFGKPEDVAWAAAFLTSPAARFITGVCLPVDGGVSIGF